MNRAVFLDRDGVINRALVRHGKPYPPTTLAELEILPEVPSALAQLKAAYFKLIVVTNQPDVARGTQTQATIEEMHKLLKQKLPLDDFEVCYHDTVDNCDCRKPKPGMILSAAKKYNVDVPASYLVGDRWRDIEAGQTAGCRTIFIDYNYAEPKPTQAHCHTDSLASAVAWILQIEGKTNEISRSTSR